MSEKWELFVDMFWKCKSNQETNFIITCRGIKIQKHRSNVLKNNPLQDRETCWTFEQTPTAKMDVPHGLLRIGLNAFAETSVELGSIEDQKAISLHFIDICVISKLYVVAR